MYSDKLSGGERSGRVSHERQQSATQMILSPGRYYLPHFKLRAYKLAPKAEERKRGERGRDGEKEVCDGKKEVCECSWEGGSTRLSRELGVSSALRAPHDQSQFRHTSVRY